MTDTTTAPPLACTTPTPPGFSLPCPACQEEADFSISLHSLEDDGAFTCGGCTAEFSFAGMRRLVNVWARVLPRVAAMAVALGGDVEAIGDE